MRTRRIESRIFANDFELWAEAGLETVLGEHCFDWAGPIDSIDTAILNNLPRDCNTLALVGMGGATLSTAAYECVCRDQLDRTLVVLDSTSSDSLTGVLGSPPKLDCHYIIASKSGQTLETLAIARTLLAHVKRPNLFTVLTDSRTSPLGSWATQHGISIRFSDPYVPGRFSGLAKLALVPTALLGIDVAEIQNARDKFAQSLVNEKRSVVALRKLAEQLAVGCLTTRSELHISASQRMMPVAKWVEQLVAESLGKSGLGILPVISYQDREGIESNEIKLHLEGDEPTSMDQFGYVINNAEQLAEFFLHWQSAVSMAAYLVGIDPYNQPEVERAKQMHRLSLDSETKETLERGTSPFQHHIDLKAENCLVSIDALFKGFEISLEVGDYIALFAYVNPTPANEAALASFAEWIELVLRPTEIRVILSFGPQYLHSTGQFHKSLAKSGRKESSMIPGQAESRKADVKVTSRVGHFLFIEAETDQDFAIAGHAKSFEWLIRQQAHLDATYLASIAHYRTVTPSLIQCGTDIEESLQQLQTGAAFGLIPTKNLD